MPIEKRAAACRVDIPSSIAPTTRSRRSTLYGLPIDASDLCRGIESLFPSLGNPPDSLFRENALDLGVSRQCPRITINERRALTYVAAEGQEERIHGWSGIARAY